MAAGSVGMEWARKGEDLDFLNRQSLKKIDKRVVVKLVPLSLTDLEITFRTNIPDEVKVVDGLENMTWTPSATITNSSFESCRARRIPVTTPQRVIIENNILSSSGSAIFNCRGLQLWV